MRTLAVVFLCCGLVAAQDSALREKLQKQMEEISRLMRDSEGKLLEMTRVDTIVETQARVVDELQKLLDKPPPATNAAVEQREKRRQELEAQQEDIARKLKEMFDNGLGLATLSFISSDDISVFAKEVIPQLR